jgi:hypothetical protein
MDQFENAQRQRQPTSALGLADSVGRDLRYSFRGLLRRPTFTLAAVLTLALGIGANTAVFSVVNAVLLKPLSYPQSNELVSLQHVAPGNNSGTLGLSPELYFTYRDENRTFEHLGAFSDGGATVTGIGDPEQARIRGVLDGVLQALGVQPMLGRWFSAADHAPQGAGPVFQLGGTVILTHAYWQRKFGGDPGVIGRSMSINSRPTEIVGVMPAGFRFLNMTPEAELILPMQFDRSRVVLPGSRADRRGVFTRESRGAAERRSFLHCRARRSAQRARSRSCRGRGARAVEQADCGDARHQRAHRREPHALDLREARRHDAHAARGEVLRGDGPGRFRFTPIAGLRYCRLR